MISNENQHCNNPFFSKQLQKLDSDGKETISKDLSSIKRSPILFNAHLFKSSKHSTQSAFNHRVLTEGNANPSKFHHSQSLNSLFDICTSKRVNLLKEQSKCALSMETIKELK